MAGTNEVFTHLPDTLVTSFFNNEIHQTFITLADLRRIHPQIRQPSGTATVDEPKAVICWRPGELPLST